MKIVEVESLSFTYAGVKKPALSDINLQIDEGEFVLIAGPSGGGKSTLCRCLNGLVPQFYEGEYSGRVVVDGLEADKTPIHVLSQHVGMVFQNPHNQLFSLSVESDIAFPLENLGLPREEIRQRVEEALSTMRIEHLRDRSPFELSGGQQQRVAIASVLAMRPRVIVMDEPTSYLDPLSASNLFKTIDEVRSKLGLTVLLVEHRVDLAVARASRLVVVAEGRIIYNGPPRTFFEEQNPHLYGVAYPKVVKLSVRMRKALNSWSKTCINPEEFEEEVRKLRGGL
ncbi:MAG: energy-coupling factor ABC transporter ATP-binding protein [Candidatus Caldarchaeum sp.]|nr:energy-coupling factor ABC transporter ATP-binding protein [Candidatus Caldarchaeum sp.]MDW8359596.1 ABC transporter ATP-binding protein [Candidatus Caldarchaeum sp.]